MPYTFRYKDDGLVLNADSAVLPFVDITMVAGLDQAPVRETSRVREGQDGGFMDAEFEDMRTVVLDGIVYATPDSIQQYLQQLKANWAPGRLVYPFYFDPPGVEQRVLFGKSLGMRYSWEQALRTGRTPAQFTLKCEDPTIYGSVIGGSGGMAIEATGRAYDKAFDYGYGGTVGAAGGVTVNNSGDKAVPATIRVTNVTDPVVLHDQTGRALRFTITLGDGDFLDMDLRNRSVMLNGTASRRNALLGTSRWFMLNPGTNNIRFSGTPAGTGTPTITVSARNGYR